jgi:hypothetical protein
VLRNEESDLRFLVHPDVSSIVLGEDWPYLESLLNDFLDRAKAFPAPLFQQISSLGVGPLVTHEVGAKLSDFPSLRALSAGFQELP